MNYDFKHFNLTIVIIKKVIKKKIIIILQALKKKKSNRLKYACTITYNQKNE